ncbi:MAG: glycerol-3-phosphate acyltransferase [Actinomycetota bacterium]|nr:glycerol-3-phosphate acyltransferase [Actinomycetota bacterium]
MIAFAAIVGYLIGSIPTAHGLGRLWGVDLRSDGSGNPGTNNALRLGGPFLAVLVLLIEMGKGAAAAVAGLMMAGDVGAVVAGLAAIVGNVANVWYGFKGGKGLAITGGILLIVWPAVFLPVILAIALIALITKSSGTAVVWTLGLLNLAAVAWLALDWPVSWGIDAGGLLLLFSLGATAALWQKHWYDSSLRKRRLA